jgi:hypothetical protein
VRASFICHHSTLLLSLEQRSLPWQRILSNVASDAHRMKKQPPVRLYVGPATHRERIVTKFTVIFSNMSKLKLIHHFVAHTGSTHQLDPIKPDDDPWKWPITTITILGVGCHGNMIFSKRSSVPKWHPTDYKSTRSNYKERQWEKIAYNNNTFWFASGLKRKRGVEETRWVSWDYHTTKQCGPITTFHWRSRTMK